LGGLADGRWWPWTPQSNAAELKQQSKESGKDREIAESGTTGRQNGCPR
jgi:hypothetical protein